MAGRGGGIELVAVGTLREGVLEPVAAGLSRRMGVVCRIRRDRLEGDLPVLELRDQVNADALLARLEASAGGGASWLVGVTARDLGTPLFAQLFGQARLRGRAAVVSLARLEPGFYGLPDDPGLVVRRAVLEILHELGHLAGREHCRDFGCLMHRAETVEAIDVRGDAFCPACRSAFPRGWLRRT